MGKAPKVQKVAEPKAASAIPVADRHALNAVAMQLAGQYADGRLEYVEVRAKLKDGDVSRWRLG